MRLFKITNPKFQGEVDVLYNDNSLSKIDFANARMNFDVQQSLKTKIPVTLEAFSTGTWCGNDTTIVEANYEILFKDFWVAYDKKINKIRAENIWDKLTPTKKIKALIGVKPYDKFLKKEQWGRAKADPENYLRNEMWENEYK